MKRKVLLTAALMLALSFKIMNAQESGKQLTLSLREAQEYAIQNNKMMISSRMDVEASRMAIWETISNALPQITASGSFTDNLKLMTTLLPGEFFGMPGEKIPVTFGSQFNTSASVQASLLLFNAPLYIGIQTTKLANQLSQKNVVKTELDTRESVGNTYFLILMTERSLEILNQNIANLGETLKATKAMLSAGMAEQTDVDQMASNLNMVMNSRSSLERAIEVNYNLMRFQLGLTPETGIKLSQDLESITNEINVEAIMSQEFDYKQNVDYSLLEAQEKMSELALKTSRASVLPTLAGFYSYGTNGMGDKINDQRWFANSMVGLQLSVPIFASGQRYSQIKKAQINLSKAVNTREMVTEQLLLQEKQLRYNLVNANQQYLSQKENVEVSKRVYTSTENKFRQGMASSLDLTQANSLYLQAENNYITALMNLMQTKLALDKLLNNM
ncbi:MAG TPA: TolC family protein [Bacteroidales bacterium]|nr:TolC family protein [Bacteroidales bacterium]